MNILELEANIKKSLNTNNTQGAFSTSKENAPLNAGFKNKMESVVINGDKDNLNYAGTALKSEIYNSNRIHKVSGNKAGLIQSDANGTQIMGSGSSAIDDTNGTQVAGSDAANDDNADGTQAAARNESDNISADATNDTSEQMTSQETKDMLNSISQRMSDDDASFIKDLGMDFEKYNAQMLDKVIDALKNNRQELDEFYEGKAEELKELAKQIDEMAQPSREIIEKFLRASDLPVTEANIKKVTNALNMSGVIPNLSSDAKAYIVENDIPLTIEEIYKASFSSVSKTSIYSKLSTPISDEEFAKLQANVENVITASGQEVNGENVDRARWMINNNVSLNETSFYKACEIDEMVASYTKSNVMSVIANAMNNGYEPQKVSLTSMRAGMAIESMASIQAKQFRMSGEATDFDKVLDGMKELRLKLIEDIYSETLKDVSVGSNDGMEILKQTVTAAWTYEDIRSMSSEHALLDKLTAKAKVDDYELGTYAKELDGAIASEVQNDTESTLSPAGKNNTAQADAAFARYETMETQVRPDLGDSVKKAFDYIPSLLDELGIEATKENVRAVKMLSYAQIEINQQHIDDMKLYDMKVSDTFSSLKPAVVVEMIKEGINPLDMTFDELQSKTQQLSEKIGADENLKYSEYLYKLEQTSQLSEKERQAYIGVYRLIRAVEKTDGAAIATTINSGRDLTMSNLLSAVRTWRGNGIDAKINDEFGALDEYVANGTAIDEQIIAAADDVRQSSSVTNEHLYENYIVNRAGNNILDGALDFSGQDELQAVMNEDIEKLAYKTVENETVENQIENNQNIGNRSVANHNADSINGIQHEKFDVDTKVIEFMQKNSIEINLENISSAKQYLKGSGLNDKKIDSPVNTKELVKALEYSKEQGITGANTQNNLSDITATSDVFAALDKLYDDYLTQVENHMQNKLDNCESSQQCKELALGIKFISFGRIMSQRRSYQMPLEDSKGNITNVNLTFASGNTSNVVITMETQLYGKVKVKFLAESNKISGMMLSNSQKGVDTLRENKDVLVNKLASFTDKDITINFARMQTDETLYVGMSDYESGKETTYMDTETLCQIAGKVVEFLSE